MTAVSLDPAQLGREIVTLLGLKVNEPFRVVVQKNGSVLVTTAKAV